MTGAHEGRSLEEFEGFIFTDKRKDMVVGWRVGSKTRGIC